MYISTATILPFLTLPLALAFPLPATDLALAIHKRGNNPSPPATRGFHILESDNFAALAKNEIRERSVGGTGKSDDKEKRGVHYDPDVARLNDVVVDKKMREKKRGVHLDLGEDVARLNDFEE